jgi:hypothetical protein
MPDISKCLARYDCPLKQDCYRYTSLSDRWQSYMDFRYDKDKKTCEDFMPVSKSAEKRINALKKSK